MAWPVACGAVRKAYHLNTELQHCRKTEDALRGIEQILQGVTQPLHDHCMPLSLQTVPEAHGNAD